ncbi:hypothetical protein QYF36_006938 [Acer negundo]|nr:hypothetical protein QYF36_006938 [Acer negundo]
MPKMSEAEVSRFWDNVPSRGSDGCWEWTGDCVPGGYGRFRTAGKNYAAHRLSMSIANKEIDSKFACHTCDNRKCVNPDHLYPGDNITNAQDRTIRKRKPSQNKHRVGFCRNPECELPECVSAASAGEKVIASVRGVIPSICKHGHILTDAIPSTPATGTLPTCHYSPTTQVNPGTFLLPCGSQWCLSSWHPLWHSLNPLGDDEMTDTTDQQAVTVAQDRVQFCINAIAKLQPHKARFEMEKWLAASPEPVPATNQAGEVKRLRAALRDIQYEAERENGGWVHLKRAIAVHASEALATQPATSQEGEEPTCERCDRGVCVDPHYEDDDRLNRPAATPTPPTLSEDLREAAQAVVDDYPVAAGMYPSLEGTDGKPGYGSIRRLAAALAQVKAS